MRDFEQASLLQKQICAINDQIYAKGSHPLQAMQKYQLGKLLCQVATQDKLDIAREAIQLMQQSLDDL